MNPNTLRTRVSLLPAKCVRYEPSARKETVFKNTPKIQHCIGFALQQLCGTDPRVQEKKLHAMEFTVSNCCYLCVLASTVLQTDSKVERWQCRESKLTLPTLHQKNAWEEAA
jgi:hypothetical protein